MSQGICSKFRTLSSSTKFLKIDSNMTSYRQFKGGNFFETQCIIEYNTNCTKSKLVWSLASSAQAADAMIQTSPYCALCYPQYNRVRAAACRLAAVESAPPLSLSLQRTPRVTKRSAVQLTAHAPRLERETRILLIGGRCLQTQILRERGHPLPKCRYHSLNS